MVIIYCKLIISKRKTIDEVPNIFKDAVIQKLKEFGYTSDGKLIVSEF